MLRSPLGKITTPIVYSLKMVSPENIHAIILYRQNSLYLGIYAYTHIHTYREYMHTYILIINGKDGMNLKESKDRYEGGVGSRKGKGNAIIL